jgi:hypothetical protein
MAFVLSGINKLENAVRLTFIIGFAFAVLSLIVISITYGVKREYRFEIAIIFINWSVLLVT